MKKPQVYSLCMAKSAYRRRSTSTLFMLVPPYHAAKKGRTELGLHISGEFYKAGEGTAWSWNVHLYPGDCPENQAGHLGVRRRNISWGRRGRGCSQRSDQPSSLSGPATLLLLHRGQGDTQAWLLWRAQCLATWSSSWATEKTNCLGPKGRAMSKIQL